MTFWDPNPDTFDPTTPSPCELLEDWDGLVKTYGAQNATERLVVLLSEYRDKIRSQHSWPMRRKKWIELWDGWQASGMVIDPTSKSIFNAIRRSDENLVKTNGRGSLYVKIEDHPPGSSCYRFGVVHPLYTQDPTLPDCWADGVVPVSFIMTTLEPDFSCMGLVFGGMKVLIDAVFEDELPEDMVLFLSDMYRDILSERGFILFPNPPTFWNMSRWEPDVILSFMQKLAMNRDYHLAVRSVNISHQRLIIFHRMSDEDILRTLRGLDEYDPEWRLRWSSEDWTRRWLLQVTGSGRQDLRLVSP